MSSARAVRYRRLALAEEEKAKADLLLKLADECDRGVLCTAQWLWPARKNEQQQQQQPQQPELKAWRFE